MKLAKATRFLAILAFAAGVATAQDKGKGGLDQYRLGAGDEIKVRTSAELL
jgi:hypothetical protein